MTSTHSDHTTPPAQGHQATSTSSPSASDFTSTDNTSSGQIELVLAQAQVTELTAKVTELQDQYLRAHADVLNARRRADEEISKARKFALEGFAESLLPVCDSLEAGLAIKDATAEQIREGSEATLRQLKSALERNKVVAIAPEAGTRFDPKQHQAISVVAAAQDPNTVVMVLQKGYSIAERVLRPALVTVTASK